MMKRILFFIFILCGTLQAAERLKTGDVAPDFTLPTQDGTVTLSSFKNKKIVVLYFYPKDNTPGCTREAQSFRDDKEKFEKAGAVILGVSLDSRESHKAFASEQKLNFAIAADSKGEVAEKYGVKGWFMANRVTFVIDKSGVIAKVFNDVSVAGHSKEVLKTVQNLAHATP